MDHPPAYSPENGARSSIEPPSYEQASSSPDQQAVDNGLPTLFLNDCRIYTQQQPDQVLYELKSPLDDKETAVQELTRFYYGTQINGANPAKARYEQLYEFNDVFTTPGAIRISIRGKASRYYAYKEVFLMAGVGSSAILVDGHFKASQGLVDRVKNKNQVNWTDLKDAVIATETKPTWDKDGKLQSLPKLQVKVPFDEKDLDLLVTCWYAKLWKESQKAVKEPMTWGRFKKAAGNTVVGTLGTNVGGYGFSSV